MNANQVSVVRRWVVGGSLAVGLAGGGPGCSGGSDAAQLAGAGEASTDRANPGADPGGRSAAQEALFVSDADAPAVSGTCAPRLAAETFASALCTCEDANVAGYLRTRSLDSSAGEEEAERLGGSVRVNGNYATAGYADVGGSFAVAGERDVGFAGYLRSGEDVFFNPALDVAGAVAVERDAFFASPVRVFGRVGIGRDLYMRAGAGFRGIASVSVGGQEHASAVQVEPPCACASEEIIDVPALVSAAASDNDNEGAGLATSDFDAVIGIGARLTLPGGRFYVERLGGLGSVSLRVTGKTALFVADDFVATGVFRVSLDPGAELDLFVRDNLVVTGASSFGDPTRPAATRVYVGGTGDVAIAGAAAFVGNLYAPTANVLIGGAGRVDGSLFAKNVVAAGFLSVQYDESIQDRGRGCPPVDEASLPRLR